MIQLYCFNWFFFQLFSIIFSMKTTLISCINSQMFGIIKIICWMCQYYSINFKIVSSQSWFHWLNVCLCFCSRLLKKHRKNSNHSRVFFGKNNFFLNCVIWNFMIYITLFLIIVLYHIFIQNQIVLFNSLEIFKRIKEIYSI